MVAPMRILFVVPYVPTRIRVRPHSLLKALVDRGHRVTLVTLWNNEAEREALAALVMPGLTIVAAPLPRLRSLANCLTALPTATPLQAVYCWQPRLGEMLERLLEVETFDVVHVEHLRGAHYGLLLKDRGLPVVWDSVDCISYLFEQATAYSRSLFGKWITRLELARTRCYEDWLLQQFQAVLVTSETDKQALIRLAPGCHQAGQALNSGKIKVLPNGVAQNGLTPNGPGPKAETLVLSGKMSYHANVTMALHLVQDIMPYIWAERPQVELTIAGQSPPAAVRQLAADGRVRVTGYVSELQTYLQEAAVAVVPAVYGAGIQNKILEAMACGTPVVAMERSIAALKLQPGQDILVAGDARHFAGQVLRLLADPGLGQTIGLNGYNYVKRYHNWSQIGADLEKIYQTVIDHDARRMV